MRGGWQCQYRGVISSGFVQPYIDPRGSYSHEYIHDASDHRNDQTLVLAGNVNSWGFMVLQYQVTFHVKGPSLVWHVVTVWYGMWLQCGMACG